MICEGCGSEVDEVCQDGYCRKCHKSLSFEDCVRGTWAAKKNLEIIAEMREEGKISEKEVSDYREFLKKLYPKADI